MQDDDQLEQLIRDAQNQKCTTRDVAHISYVPDRWLRRLEACRRCSIPPGHDDPDELTIGEARQLAPYLIAGCDGLDVLAEEPDVLTNYPLVR